jgi:hypothetical protein
MTNEELISAVKLRAFIPISQATFSEMDIISIAESVIETRIVPFLVRLQEGYCLSEDGKEYLIPKLHQLPKVLEPILAQAVACQLLEILGFIDKAEVARRALNQMENDVIPLLSPRIDRPRKRILNRSQLVRFS